MLVILSQKVDSESSYADELFNSYHYPARYKNQLHEEIFSLLQAIDTTRVSGTILEWALLAKFRLQMEKTTMLNFWIATSLNGRFQFISLTVDILNNLVSKQFERASILLGKVLFVRCPKKPTIIY